MKLKLIVLGILLNTLLLNAQTTTYYKDIYCYKEVAEKRAKYKKVELTKEDTVVIQKIKINGNILLSESRTFKGEPVGVWTEYSIDGKLKSHKDFDELVYFDEVIANMFDNKTVDSNYTITSYPTGESGMMQFLARNINYPSEARENNISGTVFLWLLIKKDGTVEPLSIRKSANPFLDMEAWEVVKKFPKWNPAQKNSIPIDSYYGLPIRFILVN